MTATGSTVLSASSPPEAVSSLQRVWATRWLLLQWMRRDYVVRYRQSLLGLSWAVLQPLFLLAFYGVVFRGVLHVKSPGAPYVLFAFCGLAPWTFVATSVGLGVTSVINAQTILSKVWFPREVIPLAAVGVSLIDLGVTTMIMLLLAVVIGGGLHITALAVLPAYLGLLLVTAGLVIIGSALTVFVRDLRQAIPLLLQVAFIATPVMYAVPPSDGSIVRLVGYSPVAAVISATRDAIAYGRWPTAFDLAYPIALGVALCGLGLLYFRSVESRFPDVM